MRLSLHIIKVARLGMLNFQQHLDVVVILILIFLKPPIFFSDLLDESFLSACDYTEKYSVKPFRFNEIFKLRRIKVWLNHFVKCPSKYLCCLYVLYDIDIYCYLYSSVLFLQLSSFSQCSNSFRMLLWTSLLLDLVALLIPRWYQHVFYSLLLFWKWKPQSLYCD